MRPRSDPASRYERVASIAVATAITVGTGLLVFPGRVAESVPAQVHNAGQVTERLEYVIARAAGSPVAPMRRPAQPRSRAQSQDITTSPAREQITPSVVGADTGTGSPPRTAPRELTAGIAGWWSTIGRAPAFSSSAKGLFHRDAEPMDFDSALRVVRDSVEAEFAAGRPRSVPLTQAERDAQWRAQALAAFAERTGVLNPRAVSAGASIPIGLPFGGPSHETRERERALFAQTQEIQARIQRRVDSTLAARRQRHVDSLARVDHATRSELPD